MHNIDEVKRGIKRELESMSDTFKELGEFHMVILVITNEGGKISVHPFSAYLFIYPEGDVSHEEILDNAELIIRQVLKEPVADAVKAIFKRFKGEIIGYGVGLPGEYQGRRGMFIRYALIDQEGNYEETGFLDFNSRKYVKVSLLLPILDAYMDAFHLAYGSLLS